MHEAGRSKPVLWDNPEGWFGAGGGRRVPDGAQPEGKIGLPRANPRGRLRSPS